MATTVTTKGQVTIPKEVRDLLGITPGTSVTFEMEADGRVVLRKADMTGRNPTPPSRFARLRGSATAGLTTDEIMALTRGDD
jgi:AbrB family looped-hinge helix DNA binding protein